MLEANATCAENNNAGEFDGLGRNNFDSRHDLINYKTLVAVKDLEQFAVKHRGRHHDNKANHLEGKIASPSKTVHDGKRRPVIYLW